MDSELPVLYVDAGDIRVSRTPVILRTVLGSCLGITFWSARLSVGALCHAALPQRPGDWLRDDAFPSGYRYVDVCVRQLARHFRSFGLDRQEIVVKLFGGGDVLPVPSVGRSLETVGSKNRTAAVKALAEEGLVTAAADLGGTRGRVISFHTGTGEVLVRRLASVELAPPALAIGRLPANRRGLG